MLGVAQNTFGLSQAENSSRAARLLERVPDVYVPRTMPHLSTTRVLTMEFIEVRATSALRNRK